MENNKSSPKSPKTATCYCCLIRGSDETELHSYNIRNETLKAVFQMDSITLCFSCYQRAEQAELFIRNVQKNQIELQKMKKGTRKASNTLKPQSEGLQKLTEVHLQPIELNGCESNMQDSFFVNQNENCMKTENIQVKLEIDEEKIEPLYDYDGYVGDETELSQLVKEEDEDECPLNLLKELEIANIIDNTLKKSTKKCSKIKKKNKFKTKLKLEDNDKGLQFRLETIHITREECMEERIKMAADENFLNSEYQCMDCLKGFALKTSYEKHMEKHDPSAGDFECDICKQRYSSEDKLSSHIKYHSFRYRCLECNLVRNTRVAIKEHYTNTHHSGSILQFTCPHCSKAFKSKRYLRKHQAYKHVPKKRAECEHCSKTFRTKKSLAIHIIGRHSSGTSVVKRHVCQDCGMGFSAPSQLKYHAIKHTDRRDYYCVECDKSFKSSHILQHHLRTAMPHVNYIELPYSCQHCEKRFAIKRDVERHMNRVHLNIKPYQCDQCERAYVSAWSLTDHKRLTHEGYKRPMKYPCTMCDKIFDRKCILKSHIRTHTGERPYQCSECPAQFAQAGVLRTHVKLIHLKLTRDGRPKQTGGRKTSEDRPIDTSGRIRTRDDRPICDYDLLACGQKLELAPPS